MEAESRSLTAVRVHIAIAHLSIRGEKVPHGKMNCQHAISATQVFWCGNHTAGVETRADFILLLSRCFVWLCCVPGWIPLLTLAAGGTGNQKRDQNEFAEAEQRSVWQCASPVFLWPQEMKNPPPEYGSMVPE